VKELSPFEWAVLPLKKYATFAGRAPRAEYWWFYLATIVVQIPLSIVDQALADWGPLSSLFSLLVLVPWLAVSVRRLHDINRSGWWLLAFFLVIVAIVVAAVSTMGLSLQAADSAPTGSLLVILLVGMLAMFALGITIFVFSVTPGTQGTNDYGPDPYGPNNLEQVFA
jgi:uncharacterized membrane protein YhaH (DUF805 family)